jgi:hypothetical protein
LKSSRLSRSSRDEGQDAAERHSSKGTRKWLAADFTKAPVSSKFGARRKRHVVLASTPRGLAIQWFADVAAEASQQKPKGEMLLGGGTTTSVSSDAQGAALQVESAGQRLVLQERTSGDAAAWAAKIAEILR